MLDPVARHDFMATVLTAAADDGVSVLLSSHVLAELERVADYLILLSQGRVQVAGEVDDLLASHRVLTGPAAEADRYAERPRGAHPPRRGQAHLLVRATRRPTRSRPAGRRIRSAWKNSPWPTCASPAPRRCPARPAAGARRTVGGDAMTALTMPARPEHDASLRPVPWRRMAWVTWRQHRVALAGVAALLGALAVYLWLAGLQLHHAYAAATACHPASSLACAMTCQQLRYGTDRDSRQRLSAGGARADRGVRRGAGAGPELETGTFRYAWTQGFGPVALDARQAGAARGRGDRRRRGVQRAVLLVLPAVLRRGLRDPVSLPALFDLRGVAFAAWTLAAFAIGALAGMLIRRVVPAIAATLAAYAGLALATAAVPAPALPDAAGHQQPERARFRVDHEPVVDQGRQVRVRRPGLPDRPGRSRSFCPPQIGTSQVARPRSASPSTATRSGPAISPPAGSGHSSGSRAAGCSRCRCCSSP